MNTFIVLGSVLFMAFAIGEVSAVCCGRGQYGFCKNCTRVGLTLDRKCCGGGSGHGYGCNVFCCNCPGGCRPGYPSFGWYNGERTCSRGFYGDAEAADINELKDTQDAFNDIDTDSDNVISQDEFMNVMRLSDSEDSNRFVSDADANEDAVQDEFAGKMAREFRAMDANNDGFIQAQEFDKDLE